MSTSTFSMAVVGNLSKECGALGISAPGELGDCCCCEEKKPEEEFGDCGEFDSTCSVDSNKDGCGVVRIIGFGTTFEDRFEEFSVSLILLVVVTSVFVVVVVSFVIVTVGITEEEDIFIVKVFVDLSTWLWSKVDFFCCVDEGLISVEPEIFVVVVVVVEPVLVFEEEVVDEADEFFVFEVDLDVELVDTLFELELWWRC